MSRKRRNTSSPEADDLPLPKRPNRDASYDDSEYSDEEESKEAPRVSEHFGQTSAFPGLDGDSDELFYGPAADGIDYLRMVRSEAKGVPHILTAPDLRTERRHPAQTEEGGYFHDGAYTAIAKSPTNPAESLPLAQQHFYDSLLTRFRLVQASMRCTPPLSSIESLNPAQFISFPEASRKVRAQWEAHLLSSDPHPVQIACMDPETVLELVKFLRMRLNTLMQNNSAAARVGAWVWAILGRCRDRGELSSEEISELRGLAQRAVHLLQKQNARSNGRISERNLAWEGPSEESDVDEFDTGADEERIKEKLGGLNEAPVNNKLVAVTLDMIVTVVGEAYGQRDLLELRTKWSVDGSAT